MRRFILAGVVFFAQSLFAQAAVTVIHADRILDGRGGMLRNATVVVEGSKIVRIDTTRARRPAADYELGTLTLLPGLDLNDEAGKPTAAAEDVLRGAQALRLASA